MPVDVAHLQPFEGRRVRVRLRDGSERTGEMRTELLGERAISVFMQCADGEGATLYLDDIVGIWESG